ncbi:MAG TPA: hypothetical protein VN512_02510 [Clostridia bacterium]|nr:hypothetical protein [Clostridia bacterium]
MVQRRPSTIYINKRCVRRGPFRNGLVFFITLLLLLCCGVEFLLSLLLSGATVVVFAVVIKRY